MTEEEKIKLIHNVEWVEGENNELNLYVKDMDGRSVHAWLTLRPHYCDRGHIQLNIDGPLNLDGHDSFPRYFFSFKEANAHTRTFLLWRLFKRRTYDHKLR